MSIPLSMRLALEYCPVLVAQPLNCFALFANLAVFTASPPVAKPPVAAVNAPKALSEITISAIKAAAGTTSALIDFKGSEAILAKKSFCLNSYIPVSGFISKSKTSDPPYIAVYLSTDWSKSSAASITALS